MPRLTKKIGFLGLGGSVTKNYCDSCATDIDFQMNLISREDSDGSMYCIKCALKLGIDLESHSYTSDKRILELDSDKFFIDKLDNTEKIIYSCVYCDGLLVAKKIKDKLSRTYYKVGSEVPSTNSYKCTHEKFEEKYLNGHTRKSLKCEHKFLTIASTLDMSAEAFEKYRLLTKEQPPAILTKMYGHLNYEAIAHGRKYIWCKNCGLYYELTLSRLNELQSIGINQDWYIR